MQVTQRYGSVHKVYPALEFSGRDFEWSIDDEQVEFGRWAFHIDGLFLSNESGGTFEILDLDIMVFIDGERVEWAPEEVEKPGINWLPAEVQEALKTPEWEDAVYKAMQAFVPEPR